jgi:translation initiation factor 6 (eIF-6)
MDVHIGEMNNTVRATDSQTLLSPQLLDRIARAVAELLQAEQKRQETAEADRRLRSGVSSDETQVRGGR